MDTILLTETPSFAKPAQVYFLKEQKKEYTNHDMLFKQLIRYFFTDFLKAFFPDMYEQIDLESIHFLPEEVYTNVVRRDIRKLDIVVEVKQKNTDALIIIHVEPQSSVQYQFNKRMFQYYSLLYNEYQKPIIPIAVFSYPENWEKNEFTIQALGTTYLHFRYHTLHLRKMYWRDYLRKENPVVAAFLSKMGYKEEERYKVKVEFMHLLWRLQLDEAAQRLIYGFFNSYLQLTGEEEVKYMEAMEDFDDAEEMKKIIIPYEEELKHKGRVEGIEAERKGIALKMLADGFTVEKIMQLTKLKHDEVEILKQQQI
ncbi:Rpn family recombination-promoting nuclease/putative transposase [Pseudogracilibacillus auburnensis]|uniref:Putative transposase/invertase (TIGR01784 family) n=1 Tax=Pseudogracilibacillus auburnensis TaxID=1494959 RepID=A0A2V3VJ74_9BACI|nr:Rpn family recombination-promoting nuclease/putative transposase [Pseudogracilibacillus auburnensis]PXW80838.1 putative transposase/invertase (TIGR01784 family) [Pseudogracilibacillus auburnensis]